MIKTIRLSNLDNIFPLSVHLVPPWRGRKSETAAADEAESCALMFLCSRRVTRDLKVLEST